MKRIVVLISGSGNNLQALMDHFKNHPDAKIVAVISNRADAYGLERARQMGIAQHILSHREFSDRGSFDRALMEKIDACQADLVVLAGFMRVLTAPFVEHYQGRLLNIHPSLLPAYRGLHTHRRVLAAGDTLHGATVHFVSDELDGGPAILQAQVPVLSDDTEDTLAARVLSRECIIYPQVVQWFVEDRLKLHKGQVYLDQSPLTQPETLAFQATTADI